jgi:hypothetical protein
MEAMEDTVRVLIMEVTDTRMVITVIVTDNENHNSSA